MTREQTTDLEFLSTRQGETLDATSSVGSRRGSHFDTPRGSARRHTPRARSGVPPALPPNGAGDLLRVIVPLTAEVMLMNRSLEIRIRDGGVGQNNTVLGALGLLESICVGGSG